MKHTKKIAIPAAILLLPVFFLAVAWVAVAGVSPHGGYGAGTDYCISCHDVHGGPGDYVLMREATVTETCATCHNLFGLTAPGPGEAYTEFDSVDGANATGSQYSAYENTGAARVSGHRLGVALNGEPTRNTDAITAGSGILQVIFSADYGEGEGAGIRYSGQPATSFGAAVGLYCASCHSPHAFGEGSDTDGNGIPNIPAEGNFGKQLVVDDSASARPQHVYPWSLLSSRPNHVVSDVTSYNGFCISCHDLRNYDATLGANHPDICVYCHDRNMADFPHTSSKANLATDNIEQVCLLCHASVPLP